MKIQLIDDGYDREKVEDSIMDIVRSNELCSLATVTPDEKAHNATAFYAFDRDLNFYILTPPETDHGQNLAENSSIALTVFDSHQEWTDDKQGLQVFGTAEKLGDREKVAEVLRIYTDRYPAAEQFASSTEDVEELDSRFYRVIPERIKLFDEPNFGTETWVEVRVEN